MNCLKKSDILRQQKDASWQQPREKTVGPFSPQNPQALQQQALQQQALGHPEPEEGLGGPMSPLFGSQIGAQFQDLRLVLGGRASLNPRRLDPEP